MSKELTEKWKNRELEDGLYYCKSIYGIEELCLDGRYFLYPLQNDGEPIDVQEVLAPVPSYRGLYGENDGNMPTGVFTILKIIKRDIENAQKRRSLTDLECGIKSQVVSLLKKWGVK